MKENEKKGIIILVIIAIVVIGIFLIVKNSGKKEEREEKVNEVKEEFVEKQEDGTKMNVSNKLKEEKEVEGLKIGNIQLTEKDGQLTLKAIVTNPTEKDVEAFLVDIILYDKQGKELDTIIGFVSPVGAGKSVELNAGITEDYANAYDFKVVKR